MPESPRSPQAAAFRERGYTLIPRLLEMEQVEAWIRHLERLSGRRQSDFRMMEGGAGAKGRGPGPWAAPDGVSKHRAFWPLIFNERLLGTVRALLGPDVRYLQHSDLHVGFSSFNWHRDSVSRTLGVGLDWDERVEAYRIVRIGIYLQNNADGEFRLGFVPGTHRVLGSRSHRARKRVERSAGWIGHAKRALTGRNPQVEGAEWVSVGSGDCVIFDPRVLHTGMPTDGPKYSIFVAYGVPNRHFRNHQQYYRHTRRDLDYEDLPAELVTQLRAAGLYYEPPPPLARLEEATLPGNLERFFARGLRHLQRHKRTKRT